MSLLIAAAAAAALALSAAADGAPKEEGTPPATSPKPAEQGAAGAEAAQPAPVQKERDSVEDDGYRVSLSMPTEDDRAVWREPGLRIELAVGRGLLAGEGPAPRVDLTSFSLRPRLRLDRLWSLGASFSYSIASGDYTGIRWAAMIEPMFHPGSSWGLSLGLGYGGLGVSRDGARIAGGASPETSSRTLRDDERIVECNGSAWVSQARVEYLAVVGPLFSTGPYLLGDAQWTGCTQDFDTLDRETGELAFGTQWWLHLGGTVGWWFSWR